MIRDKIKFTNTAFAFSFNEELGAKQSLLMGNSSDSDFDNSNPPKLSKVKPAAAELFKELSPIEKIDLNIADAQKYLKQLEENGVGLFGNVEEYKAKLSAANTELKTWVTAKDDLLKLNEQMDTSKLQADVHIDVAQIQSKTPKGVTTNPSLLNANETEAWELIKKTGILQDLPAFQAKLISGDKEAKTEAIQLEKALAADGKSLTVDGIITPKTIDAAKALIGEHADGIIKYEEALKLAGAPTATPTVSQAATTGKTPG